MKGALGRALLAVLVVLAVFALTGRPARAHPLAPLGVHIVERDDAILVSLKRARVQPKGAAFLVRAPAHCVPRGAPRLEDAEGYVVEQRELSCPGTLVGTTWGVDGLSEAELDAVFRVELRDGRVLSFLLDRSEHNFEVPPPTAPSALLTAALRSGLEHLLGGWDHLAFVVGLVLLLRRWRRVLLALTAFTVGHGLSLAAAVLGWLDAPAHVTELAIAVTLVWLARRLTEPRDAERVLSRPYLAALGVGLVHGLGFASAFSATGLSHDELALTLASFHVGIELGQLLVVAVTLASHALLSRSVPEHRVRLVPAFAIGALAMMWVVERLVVFA